MLKVSGLSKSFAARRVLDTVSFTCEAGGRIGIIGANGAGKTTLLRIIDGDLPSDAGSVSVPPGATVGMLRQGGATLTSLAAADAFPSAFAAQVAARQLEDVALRMSRAAGAHDRERLEAEYERALTATASAGDASRAWGALRLRDIHADMSVAGLSGGEITKLGLVDLVASSPDIALLDEPTNNLDLDALAWLDDWLGAFAGLAVIVSHDRALLDDHVQTVIEIDATTGRAELYTGGYSTYAAERARRDEQAWAAYRRRQDHERRVRREIQQIKSTALGRERSSQNDFYRRKAKKVARRAVVLERRLERELAAGEQVDTPVRRPYRVKAEFSTGDRAGDRMLALREATIHAGGRALLRAASLELGWGERVALVGPNGSGKTTLLRAIIGQHALSKGAVARSPSTRLGYLPQEEAALAAPAPATPVSAVRAHAPLSETEARRYLHRFLFSGDAALQPVARLSYGERKRLALAVLVLGGANLLLLDEPTNHLDIPSREAFESALDSFEGAMLVVTHDRYFIERFGDRIVEIDATTLHEVA
jgi:ATP-binding cassette subfamily F protein 3